MSNADNHLHSVDLFNQRDFTNFVADYATDGEYVDQARNATAKGRDQIREFEQGWVTAFPDGVMSDAHVIDGGSYTRAAVHRHRNQRRPARAAAPHRAPREHAVLRDPRVRRRRPGRTRRAVLRPGHHAGPARTHAPARGLTDRCDGRLRGRPSLTLEIHVAFPLGVDDLLRHHLDQADGTIRAAIITEEKTWLRAQ